MFDGATAFLKLGSSEFAVELRSVYTTLLSFRVSLSLRGWLLPVWGHPGCCLGLFGLQ